MIQEPWQITEWTEYYVPTVQGRQRRPVIYVAAPLPAGNSYGGGFPSASGFGGGFPSAGGFGRGFPSAGGLGGGRHYGGGLRRFL